MIPEHLIDKGVDALINPARTTDMVPDWRLDVYRDTARRIIEAVAADIWEEGYAACYARQLQCHRWPYPDEDEPAEKEYAEACGRDAATRAPNPYRAPEGK